MVPVKLKGKITNDKRLVVKLPKAIQSGAVEVILFSDAPEVRRSAYKKTSHPAFGMWAQRKDIMDSADYAARLRRNIESRKDGKH